MYFPSEIYISPVIHADRFNILLIILVTKRSNFTINMISKNLNFEKLPNWLTLKEKIDHLIQCMLMYNIYKYTLSNMNNVLKLWLFIIIDINHYFSTFLYLKIFGGFVIYHDFIFVLLLLLDIL